MVIALRKDKISLKWKLFLYILIFASAIILLFALFQILFLDDTYRWIKTRDINNLTEQSVELIKDNIDDNYEIDNLVRRDSFKLSIS